MIKKRFMIGLAVVAALAIPFTAFAFTSDYAREKFQPNFFRMDNTKLTDAQKADVKTFAQKSADLHKEFINKMVANGAMTQEQADAQIKMIDEKLAKSDENPFVNGFPGGRGAPGEKGRMGARGQFGRGEFGDSRMAQGFLDISKLTQEQKSELIEQCKKIANQQKLNITKLVNDNLLTQEQGEIQTKKIDEMAVDFAKEDSAKAISMFVAGFGPRNFNLHSPNSSTLTEQQKVDLADNLKIITELRKELVNKMLTNGALTKEQGEIAMKRIDDMAKEPMANGLQRKNGMRNDFRAKGSR